MLTASKTAPNPSSPFVAESPQMVVPLPDHWSGVAQGLAEAALLMQRKAYIQAEDALVNLLEFASMEGKVWHMLGRCHQAQQQHAKALESFERAAHFYRQQDVDDSAPASARLAQVLWDQGETTQAEAMLDLLLARRPGDVKLYDIRKRWHQKAENSTTDQENSAPEARKMSCRL
ncbi:MAG: tetratricopeptide repeat protein [Mariprofundaceae bacterium]|nr:tetratricopeptide repeat protein [Mariprofundaceae bacterium]